MRSTTDTVLITAPASPSETLTPTAELDRRGDINNKCSEVAALLREVGCDGLLLLEQENFAWLTSGGWARGVLDPQQHPGAYCNGEQRWIVCSNVDTQRLFDEEVDGLGFQLKEWPYHLGREQLINELCHGRRVASDVPLPNCKFVGDKLQQIRRRLTVYEQACLGVLGELVVHALEATCRTLEPGETEREVCAQVAHRLLHRGGQVVQMGVAADGRSSTYRQPGFTSLRLERSGVLLLTGRKYGLCVTASRTLSFGPPRPELLQEHNTACKISATYLASSWSEALPREILATGRRVATLSKVEHEWTLAPQGFVTGRAPVELMLTPNMPDLFHEGWAITWRPSVGAALSCDTILVTDNGPKLITPTETWPLKRIRVQGMDVIRPDILQR